MVQEKSNASFDFSLEEKNRKKNKKICMEKPSPTQDFSCTTNLIFSQKSFCFTSIYKDVFVPMKQAGSNPSFQHTAFAHVVLQFKKSYV